MRSSLPVLRRRAAVATPGGGLRRAAAVLLAAALLPLPALTTSGPASAACARPTARGLSGTVVGQDGRDVNVSLGFDVVDSAGRPIDADPALASYGCAKTGGYSVEHRELNHFVTFEGAAPGTVQKDGTRTTRTWSLANLPSNAAAVWIEGYARGYTGSPCKDARGRWCFNHTDVRKYGYANKIKVPVGTTGVKVVLPTTCAYGGRAGSIVGRATDAAGRPVTLKQVYVWTEHSWNTAPGVHGWGEHAPTSPSYALRSLASGQRYVVWAWGPKGDKVVKKGVLVNACTSTPLNIRVA